MGQEDHFQSQASLLQAQDLLQGEEKLPQVGQEAASVELEAWQLVQERAEWPMLVPEEFPL